MIVEQRHDAVIRKLGNTAIWPIGAIMLFAAGNAVDFDQAAADGAHPNSSCAVVCERYYLRGSKRIAEVMTHEPATRIPMARTAAARARPQNPAPILVQRRHIAVAQTLWIVRVVSIAYERLRSAVEQIQPVCRRNPKSLGVVLEHRPDVILAQ